MLRAHRRHVHSCCCRLLSRACALHRHVSRARPCRPCCPPAARHRPRLLRSQLPLPSHDEHAGWHAIPAAVWCALRGGASASWRPCPASRWPRGHTCRCSVFDPGFPAAVRGHAFLLPWQHPPYLLASAAHNPCRPAAPPSPAELVSRGFVASLEAASANAQRSDLVRAVLVGAGHLGSAGVPGGPAGGRERVG